MDEKFQKLPLPVRNVLATRNHEIKQKAQSSNRLIRDSARLCFFYSLFLTFDVNLYFFPKCAICCD